MTGFLEDVLAAKGARAPKVVRLADNERGVTVISTDPSALAMVVESVPASPTVPQSAILQPAKNPFDVGRAPKPILPDATEMYWRQERRTVWLRGVGPDPDPAVRMWFTHQTAKWVPDLDLWSVGVPSQLRPAAPPRYQWDPDWVRATVHLVEQWSWVDKAMAILGPRMRVPTDRLLGKPVDHYARYELMLLDADGVPRYREGWPVNVEDRVRTLANWAQATLRNRPDYRRESWMAFRAQVEASLPDRLWHDPAADLADWSVDRTDLEVMARTWAAGEKTAT